MNENDMASRASLLEMSTPIDDILAHLPAASTTPYCKGQTIYGPGLASDSIYLVVSGTVGISQIAEDGSEVLLEIVRPDELFGESAFVNLSQRSEVATAMVSAELMTWSVRDVEEIVMRRPRLAVALLQILARRNVELTRRIESLSIDNVERRLARSLIRLSERLGAPEADGSVRMMPLTHEMLSRYVGASREIVTQFMIRFRKQGLVSYSRSGILLNPNTLRASIS